MYVDGKSLGKDECEKTKKVMSKYGVTVVCDEKEEERRNAHIVMPASAECDNLKEVADDFGVAVVCDDEL